MSDLIPEGTYTARCKLWTISETNDGKPQLYLKFVGADGFEIVAYKYFSEKALPYTLAALRTLGWTGSDPLELENGGGNLDRNVVDLVVAHETYEGRTTAKVKYINEPGATRSTPLSADKRAAFAQSVKASILALEAGKPKTQVAKPKTAPKDNPASDEIPF